MAGLMGLISSTRYIAAMSGSGAFCPNCGEPIQDTAHAPPADSGGEPVLCDACYLERFDLLDAPDRVRLEVCAACGAIRDGDTWRDTETGDIVDDAIAKVQAELGVHVDAEDVSWGVRPEQVDPTTIRMHTTFTGRVRETPVEETIVIPVTIARGSCTRCGRIAGDYYAGVVQLRAIDRDPDADETARAVAIAEEIVAEMEQTGDRDAFITDITETTGGLNLKVSTTKIGEKISRRLVTEFGGHYSTSETLVTEDEDGNEVYRVTYAVRLPPFTPGEIIDPNDTEGPVLVRSVTGNLKGTRLATGAAYEASFEDGAAPDADRLGSLEAATETTVVTVEDEHAVQVLDPETYQAKTIPRPSFLDPEAEQVRVLKSRAGLHVVPDE